jgi:hypothetical protein
VNELLQAFERGEPRLMAVSLVVGSMLLSIVGANIAWHYRVTPRWRVAKFIRRLAISKEARALYEIWRLVYYLGAPYAALYLGWVDVRAMGLGFLDWATGLRWAIVLAFATWSLLMFVWVPYLRATAKIPVKLEVGGLTWSRRVVEVIYMQAHWAFYRAACILLLATMFKDDTAVYWGTCAGVGLTCLEAWADPRVRRHIAQLGEDEPALWSAGQAIINAVGFVLTRNVWLLALIHLALEFTVPHLRAVPPPPRPPAQLARAKTAK